MGIITRHKRFILWLATYIAVFMIPFVLSIFSYFYSINIIRQESSLHRITNQKQFKNIIDQKIFEVERITNQLIWDNHIRLYLRTESFNSDFRIQIENKIKELRFLNSFIDQIYIVNERETLESGERIIPYNYKALNINWDQIYSDREKSVYLENIDSREADEELYIITKFFMIDKEKTEQFLVVFLDRDVLDNAVARIGLVEAGAGFIINSEGGVVSSVINREPDEYFITDYQSVLEEYGFSKEYFEVEKNDFVASVIRSDYLDWYYVLIVPKSVYFGEIINFQKNILYTLFTALVLGIVFSVLFAGKNYLHLKDLVKLFSGSNINEIYKKYLNEFDVLENEIKSVINENTSMKKTFSGSTIGLKKVFLRRLISGEDIDYNVLNDLKSLSGMEFLYSGYCVILVKSTEEKEDDFFSLESLMEEKSGEIEKNLNSYFVSYEGNNVIILNIENNTSSMILEEQLGKLSRQIKKDTTRDFIISAGRIYNSVKSIPVSYSEALKVLEYKTLLGDRTIFLFDNLKILQKSCKFKYLSFLENEYKVYNLFTARKYGEAKTLLVRDMDLVEEMYHDVEILKIRLAGFKNIIIESLNALIRDEPAILKEQVKSIIETRSFPGLRRAVDSIFEELALILPDNTTESIARSAKIYIENNYMKKDLSITEIAEKSGITPQHLSKIFKQINGIGLLQYINKCRIDESKKILLDEEEINIREAGSIVGYYNEITFIRNFKALTGISPGQYKTSAAVK